MPQLHCLNEIRGLFDITAAETVENNARQRIALFWGCRYICVSYSVVGCFPPYSHSMQFTITPGVFGISYICRDIESHTHKDMCRPPHSVH